MSDGLGDTLQPHRDPGRRRVGVLVGMLMVSAGVALIAVGLALLGSKSGIATPPPTHATTGQMPTDTGAPTTNTHAWGTTVHQPNPPEMDAAAPGEGAELQVAYVTTSGGVLIALIGAGTAIYTGQRQKGAPPSSRSQPNPLRRGMIRPTTTSIRTVRRGASRSSPSEP